MSKGKKKNLNVMQGREKRSRSSLNFFPTPPWATRALVEIVLPAIGVSLRDRIVWEPACGAGHMARVLEEYAEQVIASDVHDYGIGARVGSFIGEGIDVVRLDPWIELDAIITNPPYKIGVEFIERAIADGVPLVAMLLRTNFLDGLGKYRRVFKPHPPAIVAQFAERVPMHEERWDPDGDTMTPYAWFVWNGSTPATHTRLMWIEPGQRQALEKPDDRARFGSVNPDTLHL